MAMGPAVFAKSTGDTPRGDMSRGGMGIARPVSIGLAVVAAFFAGFGGWAAVATLESAAIAPGVVSVASNRKTVQHLEGGIVGEILVRDGDQVSAGQVLIRLDETQPRATLDLLRGRRRVAAAARGAPLGRARRRRRRALPRLAARPGRRPGGARRARGRDEHLRGPGPHPGRSGRGARPAHRPVRRGDHRSRGPARRRGHPDVAPRRGDGGGSGAARQGPRAQTPPAGVATPPGRDRGEPERQPGGHRPGPAEHRRGAAAHRRARNRADQRGRRATASDSRHAVRPFRAHQRGRGCAAPHRDQGGAGPAPS